MTFQRFNKYFGPAVIVAGNMVPFYGLWFWGWDIFSIFFLYWAENAIIGFFMLLVMGLLGAQRGFWAFLASIYAMVFFTFHYGLFCTAHIAIIMDIFGKDYGLKITSPADILNLLMDEKIKGFYWAFAGLAIAQGVQIFEAYRTKYSKAEKIEMVMFAPYGRIIVLHVGILIGGLLAQEIGQPIWALAVLIALKTLYDLAIIKLREQDNAVASENP